MKASSDNYVACEGEREEERGRERERERERERTEDSIGRPGGDVEKRSTCVHAYQRQLFRFIPSLENHEYI